MLFVARKDQLLLKIKNFQMNKIINKFVLTGDKFTSELHLKQLGFTYSACGTITKPRERIPKLT